MQMRSLIPTDRNLGAGLTDCLRITWFNRLNATHATDPL